MWPSLDTQASVSWWVLSQFFCRLNGSVVRSSQVDVIMYCYCVQFQQPFEGKNTRKDESMQPSLCHVRTQGEQKKNSLCCWWWGGWFGGWAATIKEVNSTDNQWNDVFVFTWFCELKSAHYYWDKGNDWNCEWYCVYNDFYLRLAIKLDNLVSKEGQVTMVKEFEDEVMSTRLSDKQQYSCSRDCHLILKFSFYQSASSMGVIWLGSCKHWIWCFN